MSFHEKLQVHVSAKGGDWLGDGHPFAASWVEAGPCVLVAVPHVLRAADVVDAHVGARARGASVTLAFGGSVTSVARQTAERLGVALLDVSLLPDAPVEPVADVGSLFTVVEDVAPEPTPVEAVLAPVESDVAPVVEAAEVSEDIIEVEPEVAPVAGLPVAAVAAAFLAARVEAPEPVRAEPVVPAEPVSPVVPWAGLPRAGPSAVAALVTPEERAAMPWATPVPVASPSVPWAPRDVPSENAITVPASPRAEPALSRAHERVDSLRAFLGRAPARSEGAVPFAKAPSHTSAWLDQLRIEKS